jgi:hypothetical protein
MTPLIQGSDSSDGRHFAGPFVRIVYFELEPSCGGRNPKHVRSTGNRSQAARMASTAAGRRDERESAPTARTSQEDQ